MCDTLDEQKLYNTPNYTAFSIIVAIEKLSDWGLRIQSSSTDCESSGWWAQVLSDATKKQNRIANWSQNEEDGERKREENGKE